MQNLYAQQASYDKALDYLFQVSVEEQFESLRRMQNRSEERTSFMQRMSQWIRGENGCDEPYEDYLTREN